MSNKDLEDKFYRYVYCHTKDVDSDKLYQVNIVQHDISDDTPKPEVVWCIVEIDDKGEWGDVLEYHSTYAESFLFCKEKGWSIKDVKPIKTYTMTEASIFSLQKESYEAGLIKGFDVGYRLAAEHFSD